MHREKVLNSGFWIYTILSLIQEVVEICFRNEVAASLLAYALFLLAISLLAFFIPSRNRVPTVIIYVGVLFLLVINAILFPATSEYTKEGIFKMAIGFIPIMLILSNITNWDDFYKKMKKYAIPYFVCGIIYFTYYTLGKVDEEETNYMRMAYNVLMPACIIGYIGIVDKKLIYQVVFWVSLVAIFLTGCRGALMVGVLVYFTLLFFSGKTKSKGKIALIVIVLGAIAVLNINTVEGFLVSRGYDSRLTKKLDEGTIFQSQGREIIQAYTMADVQSKGFTPQGLYGDREITGRLLGEEGYVHNIVLEFIVDFGIVAGIALFLFLFIGIAIVVKKSDSIPKMFLLLYAAYSLTKLMVSSSYLIEGSFFCMLGVLIAAIRQNKRKKSLQINRIQAV